MLSLGVLSVSGRDGSVEMTKGGGSSSFTGGSSFSSSAGFAGIGVLSGGGMSSTEAFVLLVLVLLLLRRTLLEAGGDWLGSFGAGDNCLFGSPSGLVRFCGGGDVLRTGGGGGGISCFDDWLSKNCWRNG